MVLNNHNVMINFRLELGDYIKTHSLVPALYYTPWVTINGEVSKTHITGFSPGEMKA